MAQNKNLKSKNRTGLIASIAAVVLVTGLTIAQDSRVFRGTNARGGRASVQTGVVVAETVWNNVGRAWLRWFDPTATETFRVDNGPSLATSSTGTWSDPVPGSIVNPNYVIAGNAVTSAGVQPYLYATSVAGTSKTDPTQGATASYTWTLSGLDSALRYEVSINTPGGPTNIDPTDATTGHYRFQSRYWVVRVTDNTGSTTSIVDSIRASGWRALNGPTTDKTYVPNGSGQITVTLYNTVPLASDIGFLDSDAAPGNELIYADAVAARAKITRTGGITATPVVAQLENISPVTGVTDVFPQRVVSARNDSFFAGSQGTTYNVGVVSSFVHNGTTADVSEPLRTNRVFSWPVKRPDNGSSVDRERYLTDLEAWLTGPSTADSRLYSKRQVDNLNSSATTAGTDFVSGSNGAFAPFIGPDYLAAPVSGTHTSSANYSAAKFADGQYDIYVYIPTGAPAGSFTTNATYHVLRGSTEIAEINLNQDTQRGWVKLNSSLLTHDSVNPLSISLENTGATGDPVTAVVVADAVRFVTRSDWSVDSTPVMVSTSINDGTVTTNRDVVIVASETGRLTCMDAHGDPTTGNAPTVYWTYPTEVSASDPNAALTEDGGVAETPAEFDLTSALVQNVGGEDLLYIGSKNGRVYCFDIEGRGDGSIQRRWTYPDDFRPDAPTTKAVTSTLGAIAGSVTYATVGGTPAIIVPTSSGKILALDAAGSSASRTTTVLWQYPAATTLGPITQTPVWDSANARLYFGAPDPANLALGEMHAIDTATGAVVWTQNTHTVSAVATRIGDLGSASPVYLENAVTGIGDTVYFVDGDGYFYALDASNGAIRFDYDEAHNGSNAGLSFAYMRAYNAGSVLTEPIPTIFVAAKNGAYLGFYADGSTNASGTHRVWNRYTAEGNNQVAGFAVGGYPNSLAANRSHLYTGDSLGNLLAFSSESDAAGGTITPGDSPIIDQVSDSEPDSAALALFNDSANPITDKIYNLYSPNDFAGAFAKAIQSTLTGTDLPGANNVTRQHFEFGEQLYLTLRRLPSVATVGSNYTVEVITGNSASNNLNQNTVNLYDYNDGGTPYRAGFVSLPITAGAGGFGPGSHDLQIRVTLDSGAAVNLNFRTIQVANPFGIRFQRANSSGGTSSAGLTVAPGDPVVQGNLPLGLDATATAGGPTDRYLKPGYTDADTQEAGGYVGPDQTSAGEAVSHGSSGETVMQVYDRSLYKVTYNRALPGVKISTSDLSWQPLTNPAGWAADPNFAMPFVVDPSADLGVYKPMNQGSNKATWLYTNFEDYPFSRPNASLDYPNLSRTNLSFTATQGVSTVNAVVDGVDLTSPSIDAADLASYLGASYNNDGLTDATSPLPRNMVATTFRSSVTVPRYQPTSLSDYRSRQVIFIDPGNGVVDPNPTQRSFALGLVVANSEKLTTSTPTLDLGSMPTGGGFGDGTTANRPWDVASTFDPTNASLVNSGAGQMFQTMTVFNAGNVNMLNLRVAKAFAKSVGATTVRRSLDLWGANLHDLAWLDGQYNLITDLDPLYSVASRFSVANAAVPGQKPRPGDPAPARVSRNPIARPNANLLTSGGPAFSTTAGNETGDIRVGVAVPVGTPSGTYQRPIYVFEDTNLLASTADANPDQPALGQDQRTANPQQEPYVESGTTLKFTVREARLTNASTTKSGQMLETLLTGAETYAWANRQPSAIRFDDGALAMAWTSDRKTGSNPSFTPGAKSRTNFEDADQSRIYVASLGSSVPNTGAFGAADDHSPLNDLNARLAAGTNTWFAPQTMIPDASLNRTQLQTMFGLGSGETLTPGTNSEGIRFHSPSFANSNLADPMADASLPRSGTTTPYLAFLGETTKLAISGGTERVSRLFLSRVAATGSTMVASTPVAVPGDDGSSKSRPAVIQRGNDVAVIYTETANGASNLILQTYDGTTFGSQKRINLREQFEDVSAPTAVLRRDGVTANGLVDLFFTAKVRGRKNSEAFRAVIEYGDLFLADSVITPITFGERTDELVQDSSAGTYWAPGLLWALDNTSLTNLRLQYAPSTGGARTDLILPTDLPGGNGEDGRASVNRETGEIAVDAQLVGGRIYIDTRSGSVRFSGASIPNNARLYLTYAPRVTRIGTSANSNYRGLSAVFDQRFVGIHDPNDVNRADEFLTSDLDFTFTDAGVAPGTGDPVRYDRYVVGFNQTSARGRDSVRPTIATLRFGVKLPFPVYVSPTGTVSVSVSAGSFSGAFTYQVDPISGQVYFPADLEGVPVTVTYTYATANGGASSTTFTTPALTVGLIPERAETAMPIEQVSNESDLWLTLDPMTVDFNTLDASRRRAPLVWAFWSSTRGGGPDVYFQTLAPRLSVTPSSQ